jgi:hypothetical protein
LFFLESAGIRFNQVSETYVDVVVVCVVEVVVLSEIRQSCHGAMAVQFLRTRSRASPRSCE